MRLIRNRPARAGGRRSQSSACRGPRCRRQDKMEPFCLYDLVTITENKTVQRILCPMAVQLCHLIIALDWEDKTHQAFPDLGENAEELAKATEELASIAKRLAEESGDEVFKEEMCPAAKSLILAGRCILLAAHKLHVQPDIPSHREELAMSAKRVLTDTVKILLIEDAAKTRRIIQAADWLLECLKVLQDAEDMPGLLAAFQVFSEALLLLNNLTARCLQEFRDSPRQKRLTQTLQLLQRCVPLLHTAKHSDLKHSCDQQVSLSKDYAFQLTERTIRELTSLLVDNMGSKELHDRNGIFSQRMSRLLALLSCPDSVHHSKSEFSTHVEMVVLYSMLLADSSSPDMKLVLVKRCWTLLQLSKNIFSHINQQDGWPGQSWGESSLEEECHTMRKEVENLDQTVVTATLCQILDTFFEVKEPLKQLVENALSITGTRGFPARHGGFLKMLQPLTATFFTHAQQMLRVSDIVMARCTKTKTAREIRDCVEYLKKLLASLPPLLTEMSRNIARISTAEQLQSLYQAWAGTTKNLLLCFEEVVSMREFLKVSIQQIAKHREWCEKALESQDPAWFSWHATNLTNWAQWVVEATTRFVDRARDPIFRNGLLVWVEQLGRSIAELKTVIALSPERLSCLQTRHVFLKTVKCLIDASHHVQDGLDGSNHPDILSPLREQVRSTEVAEELGLSPSCAGLKNITDETALLEDVLSCLSPRAGNLHPDIVPRKADIHPVITALLAATRAHDMTAVNAACSSLLELSSCCINASKEALPMAESPLMEILGQYKNIISLTPCVISLAREAASSQFRGPGRLLQMALTLSESICETKGCLAAMAGSWYSLSQQVFCFILSADFLSSQQALDETMMALAGIVHLAGDIASRVCNNRNDVVSSVWESFLQVQVNFLHAQKNTKVLLEKAVSFDSSHRVEEASLELHCVLWAVSMHVLLSAVDQFTGRDVLFLRELRNAMKHKLCLQSILAAMSENSLRLQEAARLSYLSCPEDCGCSEILELREEIRVLTEALVDASNTLSVSLPSTASLYTRFELLQRDLALRTKALLLHLEKANIEHLQVIRDVIGPVLSPISPDDRERSKQAFEVKAGHLMANVQWVKIILQDVLEATAQLQSQVSLLSIADHLLLLTSSAVGSARQIFQSQQDKGHLHLEIIVWDWSAKAHYLVTQLQAVQGIDGRILELIRQCLQNMGDQCPPSQCNSIAKLFPAQEFGAPSHAELAETHPSWSGQQQNGPPSVSPASRPEEPMREDSIAWQGGPGWMSQVTKDMAARMFHMTQFLRKKGPIMTKDQFVTCARQIASDAQVFAKFGCIVAKNCLDKRCSTELLCAAEQTHTVSSQLSIVARVKAVIAESKSSSELLVSNAQNLIQAVLHVLKAAEAACIKGLRQPPPDSEEAEVAAFCTEWRKNLLWHRAKEFLNSDRDELGLRKTRARPEPTLTTMVQEQTPRTKHSIRHPKAVKGHTTMDSHPQEQEGTSASDELHC